MFTVEVTKYFNAAHGLYDFRGEDEVIHDHHWKVVVCAKTHELDVSGCAIDFHELDHHLHAILNPFINKCFNDHAPFDALSPSAENIAQYLFQELSKKIDNARVKISRVTACEDEEHCASFAEVWQNL